ncbi:MAG: YkgJ family cysteine cluster protein [Pirellulales bacterium]|nr:YkgJ family cysteine cluster protein [Pirellulales bacterium]
MLPWYHNGLHFQCTGCGDCCTGAPGYVWINKAEIEAMAAHLKMDAAKFERKYVRLVGIRKSLIELANGDCVFFDNQNRGCKIYPVRPRQCRTWPFWDSNLKSPESWEETAAHCPGCNQGPLIPREEIELFRQSRRV